MREELASWCVLFFVLIFEIFLCEAGVYSANRDKASGVDVFRQKYLIGKTFELENCSFYMVLKILHGMKRERAR
jgi:hypothetical protein